MVLGLEHSLWHPSGFVPLLDRGGPTSLDRFAAKLSYNSVIDVMPLASSLQGRAAEDERDYIPHRAFVHRKSNEVVFGCNG